MNYKVVSKVLICVIMVLISYFVFKISFNITSAIDGYTVSDEGNAAVKVGKRILLFNSDAEMISSFNVETSGENYEIFQVVDQDKSFYIRMFRSEYYYEYDFSGEMISAVGRNKVIAERKDTAKSGEYLLIYKIENGTEHLYLTDDMENKELHFGNILMIEKVILPITFVMIMFVMGLFIISMIDYTSSISEMLKLKINLNTDVKQLFQRKKKK